MTGEAAFVSYPVLVGELEAERDAFRTENERLQTTIEHQVEQNEALLTAIERLRAENALAANELVEYAKLAAAGTAEQQQKIERLRAEVQRVQSNHVTVAEEIQRRHDACAPLTTEIERLRAMEKLDERTIGDAMSKIGELAEQGDELRADNERLRAHIEKGHSLVNDMDLRMPEQATEDADGWINSYRIPVGPWHRLLGWARGGVG